MVTDRADVDPGAAGEAARRLTKRAFRARDRKFLAEGPQAVREALRPGRHRPRGLRHPGRRGAPRRPGRRRRGRRAPVHLVSGEVMSALAQTVTPQGVVAVCALLDQPLPTSSPPHHGWSPCWRTRATRATPAPSSARPTRPGPTGCVLTGDSVDPYNGKCVRATAGSLFHLPVAVGGRVATTCRPCARPGCGCWPPTATPTSTSTRPTDAGLLDGATAWVFGNEAWGLPDETRALVRRRREGPDPRPRRVASTSPPPPRSASTPRRGPSAVGRPAPSPAPVSGRPGTCAEHDQLRWSRSVGSAGGRGRVDLRRPPRRAGRRRRARRRRVFNPAAERITGIDAQAALGKDLDDALPLEGLDGRAWWPCAGPYAGLAQRHRPPGAQPDAARRPGGAGHRALRARRAARPGDAGSSSRSATPRHRAREELSRAELVSTVAHELRSPLTSVKGFTATLLAKWDRFTDEQKRLMLETVNADADRVTRLITELLDIARIDSGRLDRAPAAGRPGDGRAPPRGGDGGARRGPGPLRRPASPTASPRCGSTPTSSTRSRQPAGERRPARRRARDHRASSRPATATAARRLGDGHRRG